MAAQRFGEAGKSPVDRILAGRGTWRRKPARRCMVISKHGHPTSRNCSTLPGIFALTDEAI